uniref:Protein argonaute-2 (inferred by orthology to a D. melanogaster protein) n=1 Tax=Strongyloides venezuelensis TaxID=75913 RepID=A0A0K0F6W1_STRVS
MSNNKIATQLHKITFAEGTSWYRYNCKVEVVFPKGDRTRDLTRVNIDGSGSPVAALEKRNGCKFAVKKAYEMSDYFGSKGLFYAYDGVSNFISNMPLNVMEFSIDKDHLGMEFKTLFKNGSCKVSFEEKPNFFKIDLANFIDNYGKEEDKVITNCLDLIITQQALNEKENGGAGYIQLKSGKSLTDATVSAENGESDTGPGRVIVDGFTKGIKFVNIGGPCYALSIDATKNVYYKAETLDKIIKDEIFGGNVPRSPREFNSRITDLNIKGVYVQTTHRNNGDVFKFKHDLHDKDANNTFFDSKDGSKTSVADYFKEKLNYRLRYPEWPLFVHKVKKTVKTDEMKETVEETQYYPLEVLRVIPGQQVPVNKMDPASASAQQRINTVGPFYRKGSTNIQLYNLNVIGNENIFHKFGININPSSALLSSEFPENPKVMVRENQSVRVEGGKIKNENKPAFYSTSEERPLVVVHGNRCDGRTIDSFCQRFIARCKESRLYFERPSFHSCNTDVDNGTSEEELMQQFSRALGKVSSSRKPFLILIDEKKIKKSHTVLKVFEQVHDVITQHITYEIASKAQNQIVTLDNVVRKTNSKLGGLNFNVYLTEQSLEKFNISSKEVLYIGLDLSLAVPGTVKQDLNTSVGGWCANLGRKHGQYVGDYWYQDKKVDDAYLIDSKVLEFSFMNIMKKWKEDSHKPPSKIVFFRCGLSDTQFEKSLEVELSRLLELKPKVGKLFGVENFNCNYTFVFVSKQDNTRFYQLNQDGIVENIQPGTFISKEFCVGPNIRIYSKTNPSCLGTAKLPLYYLAYDDNVKEDKFTIEKLEKIVNMLCFTYDIIPSAVSIPAPTYIAAQFVKRGNNNLIGFTKTNNAPFQEDDYVVYSSKLNYTNKELGKQRFNA